MPSDRVEIAKLCSTKEWSKAIRVLDSFISQSCVVQDICNRAFCYSQLELHKHVIKDCDKALQLDPTLLQAYILKGRSFSALGRKEDARLSWEKGYEFAVRQSTDLKQLLELEDLLATVRQSKHSNGESHALVSTSTVLVSDSEPQVHTGSSVGYTEKDKLSDEADLCNAASSINVVQSKSSVAEINSDSSGKSSENKKADLLSNGGYDPLNKFIKNSDMYTESNGRSEPHALSVALNKPNDKHEIHIKSSNKSDLHTYFADEAKKNKKFCVARISKNKSISVDFRLSRGIAQVNEGKYAQAISIFDQILKEDPLYPEALIGRGTAYAFQRELNSAIVDFTEAIKSNPSAGEAWKRRGQARAALGESVEAIEDLTKALEFEPDSPDILHERGIINFKFKDFNSAIKDLSACVKLDVDNKYAYTYLGLALASIGEYKLAEEIQMKAIQLDRSFLEAWTHLTQFYLDLANPTKALECIQQILQIDGRSAKAYHLRGSLLHGMGAHRKAIKDLSVALSIESSNIDCLYLRASCYHAIGEYGKANKDYNAVLELDLDTMEKFVLQCMAFYQNEINLYTASRINSDFCWFDIDRDIDPLFKEYWCKRLHPKNVCEKVFRQPALRDPAKKGKLRKQDFAVTKSKSALQQAADRIGNKIQYSCPGFLPNRRQHRMAGLAAIEIAQKVSKAWRSLHAERKNANKNNPKNSKKVRRKERSNYPSQNRGGACSTTSGSSETSTSNAVREDRPYSGCMMSWQEVYALAVKWRQISEPCDPVVWVNKLGEEFNAGFGSNTPMILGQAKVVRYFPNYARTLDILKAVMEKRKYVRNRKDQIIDLSKDGKLKEVMQSESCSDLHRVVGDDFWLATWCNSTAFEGKQLEGTRITLLKPGENKYDFAIRTPCTPSRWEDFDAEMEMTWDALCNAYCGEAYGSTDFALLEGVRDAILRMTYYWYNFMPLSRGSAAVGFVVLLGLFMAANMEFLGNIPQGVQVDWDAILNLDPTPFVESVKSWLYPSLKVTTAWKEYPDVASTFSTTGSVVAVLSSYDD